MNPELVNLMAARITAVLPKLPPFPEIVWLAGELDDGHCIIIHCCGEDALITVVRGADLSQPDYHHHDPS